MHTHKLALLAALAIAGGTATTFTPPATAQVSFGVSIGTPPPAPRYEAMPAPRVGYVWAPGYWNWSGRRYVWVRGTWHHSRPGYVYIRPSWVHNHGRWTMHSAHWQHNSRDRRNDHDRGNHNGRGHDHDNDHQH